MCLILLAYQSHPQYPLILLANRDEFYARPTAQAAFWSSDGKILAGKDLQAGGTWMGMNMSGKLAALTNYRSIDHNTYIKSRGALVSNYLKNREIPESYINQLSNLREDYAGYNILVGQLENLQVYSNINNKTHVIQPGIHGLSNRFLNTDWFKVKKGKQALSDLIQKDNIDKKLFLEILQDRQSVSGQDLPETGFTKTQEEMLSPLFIKSPLYGTRCSTIITIDCAKNVTFFELSYGGEIQPESVEYQFQISA
jgi:uncharacterized protein with NRDE domain